MRENDIRPEALLKRYLELSAQDAIDCFGNEDRVHIDCVACGATNCVRQFEKNGFEYCLCASCSTLFQSPRPSIEAFEAFYRQSESSRYWAEVFFPAVAEIRREKIFRPRVERLSAICSGVGLDVPPATEPSGVGVGVARAFTNVALALLQSPSSSTSTSWEAGSASWTSGAGPFPMSMRLRWSPLLLWRPSAGRKAFRWSRKLLRT